MELKFFELKDILVPHKEKISNFRDDIQATTYIHISLLVSLLFLQHLWVYIKSNQHTAMHQQP